MEGEEIPFTLLLQTAKGAIMGLANTQHCRQREPITQPFHHTECLCVWVCLEKAGGPVDGAFLVKMHICFYFEMDRVR